ncbi:MAG: hypothetical protein AABY93_08170 [Bacteroidota bacterium]
MRLAQLARKLAVRSTVIVEFLSEQNIQIEDGSNTRLEDDHVTLIMKKFAPARAAEVAAELAIEKETTEEVNLSKETDALLVQTVAGDSNIELPVSESEREKIEVIKAAKVELSGLKVLGKIELPETKKKEPEYLRDPIQNEESALTKIEKKLSQENRKAYPSRKEKNEEPVRKNPIALQRERDAIEAEKRRLSQLDREKEKRTQHYFSKVKVIAPIKSVKLVKEEVEEMVPLEPVPKTWWGKFMKWLNT